MSTKLLRLYHISDDKLMTYAGLFRAQYIKYKMFFTSFNSVTFHETYEDNTLGKATEEAKETMSDAFIVKLQRKETVDKEKAEKRLIHLLKVLNFHVVECFASSPVILEQFRLTSLSKMARNTDGFIGYAKDVLARVEKHKAALLASGMKEELIGNTTHAYNDLDDQRREQLQTIRDRPGITQDRIEKMNTVWSELVKINKAAELIFFSNPEIQKLFELPRGTQSITVDPVEATENSETEQPEEELVA